MAALFRSSTYGVAVRGGKNQAGLRHVHSAPHSVSAPLTPEAHSVECRPGATPRYKAGAARQLDKLFHNPKFQTTKGLNVFLKGSFTSLPAMVERAARYKALATKSLCHRTKKSPPANGGEACSCESSALTRTTAGAKVGAIIAGQTAPPPMQPRPFPADRFFQESPPTVPMQELLRDTPLLPSQTQREARGKKKIKRPLSSVHTSPIIPH